MLRSRNTQLVGDQDLETGKRVSIENLKRLVSEHFPEADLKVRMSCKTNHVYYVFKYMIILVLLSLFFNPFIGGAHESANVSATSQRHMASTGIPCDGKSKSRLEWRPRRLFGVTINIG